MPSPYLAFRYDKLMNKFITKPLTLLFVFFFSGLSFAQGETKIGENWALSTQSGENVSWHSLQGKPLILHFWATWCPYCKKLQPGLEKLHKKYQSQELQLIGISFREDPGTYPQTVLNNRGHEFTTLVDGDHVAELFGVSGTPTTLFINADGLILGVTRTSNPEDPDLEKAVKILLSNYQSN